MPWCAAILRLDGYITYYYTLLLYYYCTQHRTISSTVQCQSYTQHQAQGLISYIIDIVNITGTLLSCHQHVAIDKILLIHNLIWGGDLLHLIERPSGAANQVNLLLWRWLMLTQRWLKLKWKIRISMLLMKMRIL